MDAFEEIKKAICKVQPGLDENKIVSGASLKEDLDIEAYEKKNLGKLRMHTGIETGLVITGDKFIGKGRQGLTGDTVNLASRLTGLAKSGEIIIGTGTYKIAKNHFSFESRDPVTVKGKKEPVHTFQVIDPKRKPERTKT